MDGSLGSGVSAAIVGGAVRIDAAWAGRDLGSISVTISGWASATIGRLSWGRSLGATTGAAATSGLVEGKPIDSLGGDGLGANLAISGRRKGCVRSTSGTRYR